MNDPYFIYVFSMLSVVWRFTRIGSLATIYLRILGDRAGNIDSILEVLGMSYGIKMASHVWCCGLGGSLELDL
jgi:hypothetical protein